MKIQGNDMRLFLGCLLAICILSTGIFVLGKSDTPIDVVRKYFELSRNHKIEEAITLWSKNETIISNNSEIVVKTSNGSTEKFRYDISYSKEIAEFNYEIVDFREFPKSEDSTVLCLSLKQKQRKFVFRVELSEYNGVWKINNMQNANEDILAVIHKDCSTVDF